MHKRWLSVLLILISPVAFGVSFAWDASPDASVTGYYLYYGTASRAYGNRVEVGDVTEFTLENALLEKGVRYYFTVTAHDADGLESDYCNEVEWVWVPVVVGLRVERVNE